MEQTVRQLQGDIPLEQQIIRNKIRSADKIQDHLDSGVEVITGADHSCLMHLEGLINRNNQPLRVMHIAEILNCSI